MLGDAGLATRSTRGFSVTRRNARLPTYRRERLPRGFSHPSGAQELSRALEGVPQARALELCFRNAFAYTTPRWRHRIQDSDHRLSPAVAGVSGGARCQTLSPGEHGRANLRSVNLESLVEAWRRRGAEQESRLRERARGARLAAEQAARVLRDEYGANEVWLFGSLADEPRHDDFDVDLAVRGITPARYFAALSRAWDVVGRPVDLVTLESCSESLRRRVEKTGIRLDVH